MARYMTNGYGNAPTGPRGSLKMYQSTQAIAVKETSEMMPVSGCPHRAVSSPWAAACFASVLAETSGLNNTCLCHNFSSLDCESGRSGLANLWSISNVSDRKTLDLNYAFSHSLLLSSTLRILPLTVLGRESTNSIFSGIFIRVR